MHNRICSIAHMVLLYILHYMLSLYMLSIIAPAKLGPPAESITGPYSS